MSLGKFEALCSENIFKIRILKVTLFHFHFQDPHEKGTKSFDLEKFRNANSKEERNELLNNNSSG